MTPQQAHRRFCYFAVGTLAVALILAVLHALALCLSFDADIGYFRAAAVLPRVLYVAESLGALAAFCPLLLIKRDALPKTQPALSLPALSGAGICGLLSLVLCGVLFSRVATLSPVPVVFAALLLLLGSGYFFLHFWEGSKKSTAPVWCGYALILAALLLLCVTYFDRYTPMNAPHKVAIHLSLLGVMLYVLYELRFLLSRAQPRGYAVVAALSFLSTAVSGFSGVVGFFAGAYNDLLYLMTDLFSLAFAFYVGARVADVCRARAK